MKEYNPYEIIIGALLIQGYSEEEATSILIEVIEEQKQLDNLGKSIHKLIEKELNDPKNWS